MNIIYEDDSVIVVFKEAGLAVESRRVGEMDLESMLLGELARRIGREGRPPLFMVHRLDQPVAGLLVFARTRGAAASLSAQVQDGRMRKIYRAVVSGPIPAESGTLTDYLIREKAGNTSRIAKPGEKGAKKAVLDYRKLNEDTLEISLHTGRHHQIRVQLSHAGMPIRGDRKYGGAPAEKLALTAWSLSFIHPVTGKRMLFTLDGSEEG